MNGIVFFNGKGKGKGGLCDRLKGMYSAFTLAEVLGKHFIFDIECGDYLESGTVNKLLASNISVDHITDSDSVYILNIIDSPAVEVYKRKLELLHFPTRNVIVNSNMDFTDEIGGELFTPPFRFDQFFRRCFDIDKLKDRYQRYDIGIHVRAGAKFVNWCDSDFEQDNEVTIDYIMGHIARVCAIHSRDTVFLCSDSCEVLDTAVNLGIPNLITSNSTPNHIDRSTTRTPKGDEGVVADLILLAQCRCIYKTVGGFAETAGRIFERPVLRLYEN